MKNKLKRTKLVCTLGPATDVAGTIEGLIDRGMNVVRMNFSHGDHEEHAERIAQVKAARKSMKVPIAILLDTKGPEIRTGQLADGKVHLETYDEVILTTEQIQGDKNRISVSYSELPKDVKVGDRILIDDGLIELTIIDIPNDTEILCRIDNGGELGVRKGVNVPNVKINLPGLTEQDEKDLIFGIEQGIDFVAASFVRKPQDVIAIRKILDNHSGSHVQIIAKIENREGVENIDRILAVCDGIMVARGDLGVEIPPEEVPLVQKSIIRKCNLLGKPVITATQMLDSMIRNPRPTRAEVADVANAVFDGTDAVMLSGETAVGTYPLETTQIMADIVQKIESSDAYKRRLVVEHGENTVTNAVSSAVVSIVENLDAKAIIAASASGYTPRMLAKYRPDCRIFGVSDNIRTVRRLALSWGVYCIYVPRFDSNDELVHTAIDAVEELKAIKTGDTVVIAAGVPLGVQGYTNMIMVHVVGDAVMDGIGIGDKPVTGYARLVDIDHQEEIEEGDIVVAKTFNHNLELLLTKAAALITEESGGVESEGAKLAKQNGIPAIVGVAKAFELINEQDVITVDPQRGAVYMGSVRITR
ncbi:MAG: pyruvate kinase [Eubacteriaceae bacterium]|nr:pyruvate kinase [Eubacteriaceae bacterium]